MEEQKEKNLDDYDNDYEYHLVDGNMFKIRKISAMKRDPEFFDFPKVNFLIHNVEEPKYDPFIEKRKRKRLLKPKKKRLKKTSYGFDSKLTRW